MRPRRHVEAALPERLPESRGVPRRVEGGCSRARIGVEEHEVDVRVLRAGRCRRPEPARSS